MPSSKEIVTNTPLTAEELKVILRADFERLLAAEGLLGSGAAFGRVAFTLAMKLHLDNPWHKNYPAARIDSLPNNQVERPPLTYPGANAAQKTITLNREIDSPNIERLAHELPVPILRQQQDGTRTVETVKYPKQDRPPRPEKGRSSDGSKIMDAEEAKAAGLNIIEVD